MLSLQLTLYHLRGEDLLGGQPVDHLWHVEVRVVPEHVPHPPAALGLALVVALLGQLDLHVLHHGVDVKTWDEIDA